MKIISYNVNGIRAALGKGLIDWLETEAPDIFCIQETKAQPEQIDTEQFKKLGYESYIHSAVKKGYSGVACFTKVKPNNVQYGIGIEKYDVEGRYLRLDFDNFSIINAYHPSGTSGEERLKYKLEWYEDFLKHINELRSSIPNIISSGDYNVCHKPIDIHDPVRNVKISGFLPEEREWMDRFIDSGYIDTFRHFNTDPDRYSWWSYRFKARDRNKGWRIDYHVVTNEMKEMLKDADILDKIVHSDHCPVLVELN